MYIFHENYGGHGALKSTEDREIIQVWDFDPYELVDLVKNDKILKEDFGSFIYAVKKYEFESGYECATHHE